MILVIEQRVGSRRRAISRQMAAGELCDAFVSQ
jgi:hypothetical protein